ncbi:MAG: hypothetical protein U1F27_03010 [Turneriella sp.]
MRFKNAADARLTGFYTYGEFMHPDDGRVISNLCVAAIKGVDVPIWRRLADPFVLLCLVI